MQLPVKTRGKTIREPNRSAVYKLVMAKRVPLTPQMAEKAQSVGQRIRAAREQKGYTQAKLAAKIGKTPGAVTQYELGYNLPKIEVLERLAAELDVTTEWLMTGGVPEEEVKAQTTAERDALKLLRAIPIQYHEAALAMLKGLTEKNNKNN
jgi:transcriptional regulator with XRE-family HTH domain